ncbi:serine/threonine protein kinase [Aequitasia blattaphilus]|uniref:non-specific serine/threonine protein kinase n=1 Tax=Aequitasia blattaphilus TaxID=2949332 RepID=A0ABT1EAU9_9FIRM|nr:Stk1 family PASTA domain-containing Ser/Thr kinase [Aequitasia blattaphilus]MCP1102744.1 Stk1 family PASTA domain-containing Ser/Thr kinase [Aequitasia blattaphilus]MCR8615384.1 Stk1 family PASTA domain-containing Ser/Thr kinase [Aequitasia blattaphilus]
MSKGIFLGKRYEVLSKIGAGGMADVYKGKDHMLNRFIAIKVLKKEFREDKTFVEKFNSEAQAAAGLTNPNIVNVYDVGEDRGLHYMVMELVEGATLKEYIRKKGRLSFKETISIAIQMCNGINAAHEAGLIHRDIKPQNIIISQEGKVKVTDFGIAKAITSNTISSNAMGSVHYTSPEQARGGYSDMRSDIYSMGITIYEMVTGEVPFDGESTVAVAMKQLREEMPLPSDKVPNIPFALEQIILKCTLKSAERRYADTQELAEDLKLALTDPDGDFVDIAPLRNADTIMISEEELDDIKHQYDDLDEDEDYDEEYDDLDGEYNIKLKKKNDNKVNPKMNRVMKVLTIAVAVIILIVLIFVIGRAVGFFNFGPDISTESSTENVTVPNILGMTEEEAKAALKKKDLGLKITKKEGSTEYEEGLISAQTPGKDEKVKKNSKVEVVISSGLVGVEIEIPNVVGLSESAAEQALSNAGFTKISKESANSDSVESGNVISTNPTAGAKATKDATITMTVSLGAKKPDKVEVPNVVGTDEASAIAAIENVGLKVNLKRANSRDVESGLVISQDPASGKKDPGTTVTITVSTGPENVTVPSLAGYSLEAAKSALTNVGLTWEVTYEKSDTVTAGMVISCSPESGESAPAGSSVNIVISDGPETPTPTPTPDPEPTNPTGNE